MNFKMKCGIVAMCITSLLAFLYLPGIFMSEKDNVYTKYLNKDVLNNYNDFFELAGDEDFDKDGLNNKTEKKIGSNPYHRDSDNDGLSDLYEYKNSSNVIKHSDTLTKEMTASLKDSGKSYKNPFSSNGIVLWANDITSRTYGNVLYAQAGDDIAYVFDRFNGYAQFENGFIPYDVSTGNHVLLEKDKDSDLYKISSGMKIVLKAEPLKVMYFTSAFGNESYKDSNLVNDLFDFILPEKGFITSKKVTSADTDIKINSGKQLSKVPKSDIGYDYLECSRFKYNDNLLTNLADVYKNINKGCSIAVSLIDDKGETTGTIYGYDEFGNLLVCNNENGQELGVIKVSIHYTKLYTDKDTYEDYNWYSFTGLGYDSSKNARISFYSSSTASGE